MARTGQHSWLCPGWKILPTRIGYAQTQNKIRWFCCEDNNADLKTRVENFHYFGESDRSSSCTSSRNTCPVSAIGVFNRPAPLTHRSRLDNCLILLLGISYLVKMEMRYLKSVLQRNIVIQFDSAPIKLLPGLVLTTTPKKSSFVFRNMC